MPADCQICQGDLFAIHDEDEHGKKEGDQMDIKCLPCGHVYHAHCIEAWLGTKAGNRCPQRCPAPMSIVPKRLYFTGNAFDDAEYQENKQRRRLEGVRSEGSSIIEGLSSEEATDREKLLFIQRCESYLAKMAAGTSENKDNIDDQTMLRHEKKLKPILKSIATQLIAVANTLPLNQKISELESERDALKAKSSELQKETKQKLITHRLKDLESRTKEKQELTDGFAASEKILKEEISKLRTQLSVGEASFSDEVKQRKSLKIKLEKAEESLESRIQTCSQLNAKLVKRKLELDKANETIVTLQKKLNRTNARLSDSYANTSHNKSTSSAADYSEIYDETWDENFEVAMEDEEDGAEDQLMSFNHYMRGNGNEGISMRRVGDGVRSLQRFPNKQPVASTSKTTSTNAKVSILSTLPSHKLLSSDSEEDVLLAPPAAPKKTTSSSYTTRPRSPSPSRPTSTASSSNMNVVDLTQDSPPPFKRLKPLQASNASPSRSKSTAPMASSKSKVPNNASIRRAVVSLGTTVGTTESGAFKSGPRFDNTFTSGAGVSKSRVASKENKALFFHGPKVKTKIKL